MDKPRIFLGSSGTQEKLLQALTRGLEDVAQVEPWTTSFNTGTTTLEPIVELVRTGLPKLARSDFSSDRPGLRAPDLYTEATLALGGRTWKNRSVAAMSMAEVSEAFGRRIDGLLGQDLLREFGRVTIDFRARTLRLE
jgi:hypothetical protein